MGGTCSFKSPNKSQISTEKRERGERGRKGRGDKINSEKKKKRIETYIREVAMVAERERGRARDREGGERGRERIEESNTGKI